MGNIQTTLDSVLCPCFLLVFQHKGWTLSIRTVLHLADKSVGCLPSATTVKEMVIEAGIVSKLQLSEILPLTEFNTLRHYQIRGKIWGAFVVSTTEGSYSLALREMKSGLSTESLDVLNTIIEEIDEISESAGLDAAGRKIIITIKNTMSDRHSAEKKFNELLEDYRTKVLSEVVENWEGMSEEQQTGIMKLNNFFCGLHFMVALADCASEALLEAERCLLEKGEKVGAQKVAPSFCSVKESGTVRLIRTACNAVHKHGSQKAGVHIYFAQYLRDEGVNSMPLASFQGNRFNIIFYDAAGIYFLHEKLKVFLESYGAKNQLLTAVLADLYEPVFRAGCKALGLINKFITGPLWRILERISQL